MPVIIKYKFLHNILHCYPNKITYVQELLPADLPVKQAFVLEFLAHIKVGNEWPKSILWIEKAHFYLQVLANAQNCRIWATENLFPSALVLLHSGKVNMVQVHSVIYCKVMFSQGEGLCGSCYL